MKNYYIFIIFSLLTILYSCDGEKYNIYNTSVYDSWTGRLWSGGMINDIKACQIGIDSDTLSYILYHMYDDDKKRLETNLDKMNSSKKSIYLLYSTRYSIYKINSIEKTDSGVVMECKRSKFYFTVPSTYYSIISVTPQLPTDTKVFIKFDDNYDF